MVINPSETEVAIPKIKVQLFLRVVLVLVVPDLLHVGKNL